MRSVFTLFFSIIILIASAQNTFKTRVYATDRAYLTKAAQLNDGSLVSVGHIEGGNGDIWLVKTNAIGVVFASKRISGSGSSEGYSIIKTSDGGFAVTGVLNDKAGLLKFNADLSVQWQQEYDIANGASIALQLVQTPDGGYLLTGALAGANGNAAGSLIKTDSLGVIQFQTRYFGFGDSYLYDIAPTKDGSYAFLAVAYDDKSNVDTNYVGKINGDGSLVWVKRFTDANYSSLGFDNVTGSSDGGVVISGYVETDDGNNWMTMSKFNARGGLNWSKVLRNANGDSEPFSVVEDKDGGYLFAGYGDDTISSYGYVVKTTSAGALVWKKTFESDSTGGYTDFAGLIATSDGGFVAAGDGRFVDISNDYTGAGILYKFNSSFDACSETAGTTNDTLVNFGSIATATLSLANTTLVAATANLTLTDVENTISYPCSIALPVHFTSFSAVSHGRSVTVSWAVTNAMNADYFVVERSANKSSFDVLQKVSAKDGSSVTQSYNINDLQPLPGTSYYRLKEVDKDGKTTYSSIVAVTMTNSRTIVISPNPVQNTIRVIVQSTANNNLSLQVVDMKGNVLAAQTKAVVAGRNEITLPASSLAKGVYILKVTDSKTSQAIRFVKE